MEGFTIRAAKNEDCEAIMNLIKVTNYMKIINYSTIVLLVYEER